MRYYSILRWIKRQAPIAVLIVMFAGLQQSVVLAQHAHCDSTTLSTDEQHRMLDLMQSGMKFEDNDQLDSAIHVNQQILNICNDFAPAMTTIAGLYGRQGKLNSEIEWANKAIAADSTYSNAYVNLGNAYALMGNANLARITLQKAMAVEPSSPLPYYTMGVIAEGDADMVAALEWYDKSIAADSTFTSSYFNAAMVYARMGEKEKAIPLLQRETEIDPSDEQAERMLVRIVIDIARDKAREQQEQLEDSQNNLNDQG